MPILLVLPTWPIVKAAIFLRVRKTVQDILLVFSYSIHHFHFIDIFEGRIRGDEPFCDLAHVIWWARQWNWSVFSLTSSNHTMNADGCSTANMRNIYLHADTKREKKTKTFLENMIQR
jgi:hypothetical protein